jgi:hypothetical protein
MDEATLGLGSNYGNAHFDPWAPWWRPSRRGDRRLSNPRSGIGGGRRMTHPYRKDILYARTPDFTTNFGWDVLPRADAVVTQMLEGAAVTDFAGYPDGTIIREIWPAQELSTVTGMFAQFYRFRRDILPDGDYIGWQPRDRTWKRYAIQLLDVICGDLEDEFIIEQLGSARPFLMRKGLTVKFKTVREVASPSSVLVGSGA